MRRQSRQGPRRTTRPKRSRSPRLLRRHGRRQRTDLSPSQSRWRRSPGIPPSSGTWCTRTPATRTGPRNPSRSASGSRGTITTSARSSSPPKTWSSSARAAKRRRARGSSSPAICWWRWFSTIRPGTSSKAPRRSRVSSEAPSSPRIFQRWRCAASPSRSTKAR